MKVTLDHGTVTCECGDSTSDISAFRKHLETFHSVAPAKAGTAVGALRSAMATFKQIVI